MTSGPSGTVPPEAVVIAIVERIADPLGAVQRWTGASEAEVRDSLDRAERMDLVRATETGFVATAEGGDLYQWLAWPPEDEDDEVLTA